MPCQFLHTPISHSQHLLPSLNYFRLYYRPRNTIDKNHLFELFFEGFVIEKKKTSVLYDMAFVYFGSLLFSHFFLCFDATFRMFFIIFRTQLFLGNPRSVYTSTMCNYEFICQMNCIFMKLNKHPSDTFTTRSMSHFYSRIGNCRFLFLLFYITYHMYNFSYWRTIIKIILYFFG